MNFNGSHKNRNVPIVHVNLKELRSCMQCKFFHGNNNQCILNNCIKEKNEKKEQLSKNDICYGCSYKRKDSGYCFPCMKKILGIGRGDTKNEEMEEKEDGSD